MALIRPVFRAAGAKSAGTTGATAVADPAGWANGDLEIMVAECETANTISITTAGGSAWTLMSGLPVTVAAGQRLYVWWRITHPADTTPSVTPSADHVCAVRLTYKCGSFDPANPFEAIETSSETTSDTSFSHAAANSTADTDRLCLSVATNTTDSNTAQVPVCTNANMSGLASRANMQTLSGNGGGFGITEGTRATAGAVGTWACTYVTASPKSYVSFAIRPNDMGFAVTTLPKLHLKADILTTYLGHADNSALVNWPSSEGQDWHWTQGTAGAQPTVQTNEINGLPCVRFDGVDDFLTGNGIVSAIKAAGAFTAFVVVKVAAQGTTSDRYILGEVAGGFFGIGVNDAATDLVWYYNWDGTGDFPTQSGPPFVLNSWLNLQARHDTGAGKMKVGSFTENSLATGNTTDMTNTLTIGAGPLATTYCAMDLCELICFNVALSTADQLTIESYLAEKYFTTDVLMQPLGSR